MQGPGLGMESQAEPQAGQGGAGHRAGQPLRHRQLWAVVLYFLFLVQKQVQQHMLILKDFEE